MNFDELLAIRSVTVINPWASPVKPWAPPVKPKPFIYYKGMNNKELCHHASQIIDPAPIVTGIIEFYQERHWLSIKQRTLLIHLLLKATA